MNDSKQQFKFKFNKYNRDKDLRIISALRYLQFELKEDSSIASCFKAKFKPCSHCNSKNSRYQLAWENSNDAMVLIDDANSSITISGTVIVPISSDSKEYWIYTIETDTEEFKLTILEYFNESLGGTRRGPASSVGKVEN